MALYPKFQVVGGIANTIKHPGFPAQLMPVGLPNYGGVVKNPFSAKDQGLKLAEPLFISIVRPPSLFEDDVTTCLQPGQEYMVPAGTHVWVTAVSVGHNFSSYFYSSSIAAKGSATPVPGDFPPSGPQGLLKVIPSYLYQEYSDDDDLQAFVEEQNNMQQNYIDTLIALNLPIYTGAIIKDALLDWVATGLYGYKRPWVYAQKAKVYGPLNTWMPNQLVPINALHKAQPKGQVIADDDFYKRCITWHYQKGDGKYFNIRWLKRRIMRFLTGVNGSSPHIDQTNQISISFGPNYECTIRFVLIQRTRTGGCLPNRFGPNGTRPGIQYAIVLINGVFSTAVTYPRPPYINQFAEAVLAGVLELPFQFNFNVVIG